MEDLCQGLLEVLNSNNCRAHTQVLESLISLLLSVESEFEPYAVQFLPTLLECMAVNEWHTRKIGIDVMYTMGAILGEVISPYTKEILEVLNHCRFDKMKPVREAAIEAINLIKDLDPGTADELHSQESHAKSSKHTKATSDKPWKKKRVHKQEREEDASTSVVYSNRDHDDEASEKKISLATKKRLEASKAKKQQQSMKTKPNLNKEKKSIFDHKKNPAFFSKGKKKEPEPVVQVLVSKEDEADHEVG